MSHATPAARHPGDGESTAQPSTSLLQLSDGGHIAYRYTPPADEHQPCVIFIHGAGKEAPPVCIKVCVSGGYAHEVVCWH